MSQHHYGGDLLLFDPGQAFGDKPGANSLVLTFRTYSKGAKRG